MVWQGVRVGRLRKNKHATQSWEAIQEAGREAVARPEDITDAEAPAVIATHQRDRILHAAIAEVLTDRQREALSSDLAGLPLMETARRMGLRTIAVYSEADVGALHVEMADEAILLGPAPALESYLDIDKVLSAARSTGAESIHPGYGFLSENDAFADACEQAGITFIGPSGEAIRAMGSKIEAKRLVSAAGTPVVPGYQGDDQSSAVLIEAAADVGYPLLIKASAGGGGKGMRLVESAAEFERALDGARREAANAFGDDRVLLERYLGAPKHLEVQILGDTHGHVVHLFERDCSVQRRHQKVIEEAPGPLVTPALRERLGEAAVTAAQAINYVGAGTVEFQCPRSFLPVRPAVLKAVTSHQRKRTRRSPWCCIRTRSLAAR